MTQKQRVLAMLDEAGPEGVTSNQFYSALLPRFSARIHELKSEGHSIVKEPVEQGHFRYILVGRATSPQCSAPAQPTGNSAAPGGQTLGDAQGPGNPPLIPQPGQLFEVEPDGPVPHHEWEAA